jgi:hypothetical protein
MRETLQTTKARSRSRIAGCAVGLLAAAGALVAAPGAWAGSGGSSTFSGSCQFEGSVSFDPPLGTATQETVAEARAVGPCTGTWTTGRRTFQLDGDEVRYRARSLGQQSCAAADASGRGYFAYRGRKLRFSFSESRVGATAAIELQGDDAGMFSGVATPTSGDDPAEVLERCASDGLAHSGVMLTGATQPTISG